MAPLILCLWRKIHLRDCVTPCVTNTHHIVRPRKSPFRPHPDLPLIRLRHTQDVCSKPPTVSKNLSERYRQELWHRQSCPQLKATVSRLSSVATILPTFSGLTKMSIEGTLSIPFSFSWHILPEKICRIILHVQDMKEVSISRGTFFPLVYVEYLQEP